MARPKEFDPETAAQEAMEAFWDHGYAGTSVSDLLSEMGLNRGSLYGTFGDKKQLFLAALEKYDEQSAVHVGEMLDRPSARAAIRELLTWVAQACTTEAGRRGCLAGKAALELAPHDADVAAWLRKRHRRHVDMLARTIRRGQRQGEFDCAHDARAMARFLLAALTGLRLLATFGPSEAEVQDVVRMMLKALD